MDTGIYVVWYDIAEKDRNDHFAWLHGEHLPALLACSGVAWAAHYEITGGGADMDKIAAHVARPAEGEVGSGKDFLVLVGASSPHVFFKPRIAEWEALNSEKAKRMLSQRIGARPAVFREDARVTGPESDYRAEGTTPAPAIQMGSFRTMTVEDEWDLAAWYAQYRLPAMSRMTGCVATRKLISVAGWAKHSILYEFLSLEAREQNFQGHESLALDEREWTNRIISYTVHAPGSPSVGRRIWPKTETAA